VLNLLIRTHTLPKSSKLKAPQEAQLVIYDIKWQFCRTGVHELRKFKLMIWIMAVIWLMLITHGIYTSPTYLALDMEWRVWREMFKDPPVSDKTSGLLQ